MILRMFNYTKDEAINKLKVLREATSKGVR